MNSYLHTLHDHQLCQCVPTEVLWLQYLQIYINVINRLHRTKTIWKHNGVNLFTQREDSSLSYTQCNNKVSEMNKQTMLYIQ